MKFPDGLGLPQEQVIERPVELMDIMPTLLDAVGVPIPDTVDGESVLPIIRDSQTEWRDYVHGECASVPTSNSGMQYVTDGKRKFAYLPGQGRELFFDVENDPCEMNNLADDPGWADEIAMWRSRLIGELVGRPEGFTDGKQLLVKDGNQGTIPAWEEYDE